MEEIEINIYSGDTVPKNYTGIIHIKTNFDMHKRTTWHLNGKLHREDGPALTRSNGQKEWWWHGLRHRENGPAVEHIDGYREWWINNKTHRLDGPAVEFTDGYKEWHLYDKLITEDKHKQLVNLIKLGYPEKLVLWLIEKDHI